MDINVGNRTLTLEMGDITQKRVDAIVNAANSSLMRGGGVDGAIHRAGGPDIHEECVRIVEKQGRLPAGKAVITTGGKLPSRFVIHTVGPVWRGGGSQEASILASAYRESLLLAEANNLGTVAFPSISTGAYGYPVQEAAVIAIQATADFLRDSAFSVTGITFVMFDERTLGAYESAASALSL